jgi:hypothetical protein
LGVRDSAGRRFVILHGNIRFGAARGKYSLRRTALPVAVAQKIQASLIFLLE